jgi:hypothetical protein
VVGLQQARPGLKVNPKPVGAAPAPAPAVAAGPPVEAAPGPAPATPAEKGPTTLP